ncbi:MAG: aldo/keto reductase [Spirochaeta sp.]|nr:aldo/keto reductase [Spirochaeta sp.]
MKYRQYANTGLEVSEICYGTMRYASKDGVMDEQARAGARTLEEAVELGVNFIHSSYEYGTRWLTGQILGKHPKRHDLHHMIKINVPDWGDPVFDAKKFRDQVEDALRDLNTDRIAVVQHLHRGTVEQKLGYCEAGEPTRLSEYNHVTEPLKEEFARLQQEGKVGFLASFPYTMGYARQAVTSGDFSGLVAYFNTLETEMIDVFDEMETAGMGFIGIRPFAAGLLTDKRVNRDLLPEDDRMRDLQFDRFYDQLTEFRSTLPQEPDSWTEFAVRFSLSHPLIASTVVGINTPEQLHSAVSAVDKGPLDSSVVQQAHKICTDFRQRFGVVANMGGVPVY